MTPPSDDPDRRFPASRRSPSATLIGLATGLALGFAAAFGGLVAFLVVLVLAGVGTAVGLVLDGRIDLSRLVDRDRIDR
jgi:hypothetical protein